MQREQKGKLYAKLVATVPDLELKGDTVPYTSVNGHMCNYLSKDEVVALRLSAADREAFMTKYNASLMTAYGIVQKEYVAIPDALLNKVAALGPWFQKGYDYVSSLKPRPTKKATKK